jgi:ABC-2 type transport system ATP-binding protein
VKNILDIELDSLTKKFGEKTVVDNVSLDIEKGELFGLLGPNGAGKTTTIKILCGLLEPTEGIARVGGFDVRREMHKIRKLIGVCPQEPAYYTFLTGRENIELFGKLHNMSKDLLKEKTDELLETVGLVEAASIKAGKYSGGMIRRVNLAMALVNDPAIAFLDEPTVAMDPQTRHATWDFIRGLKVRGKTIILTTHYIEEAESLADRIGIIDLGKLIALDTPAALMEQHNSANLEDVFIKLTGRKIREET